MSQLRFFRADTAHVRRVRKLLFVVVVVQECASPTRNNKLRAKTASVDSDVIQNGAHACVGQAIAIPLGNAIVQVVPTMVESLRGKLFISSGRHHTARNSDHFKRSNCEIDATEVAEFARTQMHSELWRVQRLPKFTRAKAKHLNLARVKNRSAAARDFVSDATMAAINAASRLRVSRRGQFLAWSRRGGPSVCELGEWPGSDPTRS